MPPRDSAAATSSPLSGPTSIAPLSVSNAIPRRSVPTPGSTTARYTASAGMYLVACSSNSAPASTPKSGTSCVRSTIDTPGAILCITPLHVPTKSSARPKSDRKQTGLMPVV